MQPIMPTSKWPGIRQANSKLPAPLKNRIGGLRLHPANNGARKVKALQVFFVFQQMRHNR